LSGDSLFLLYLLIGYGVVWIGLFAYIMYVGVRIRAVRRELQTLREEESTRSSEQGASDG